MERWSILLLLLLQLSVLSSHGHRWRKHHNRPFRCRREGLFSHSKDCDKFYRCVSEEGRLRYSLQTISCPQGLVYNDRIKSCSKHSSSRRCQAHVFALNKTRTEDFQENRRLPCEKEGFFAHPDDCKRFYRCIDYDGKGKSYTAFEYTCPKKLLFNKELNSCDWPNFTPPCSTSVDEFRKPPKGNKIMQGPSKHEVESSPGKIQLSKEKKEESDSFKCKKEGFFRNPENCRKFYRCVYSGSRKKFHIYHFKCPQSLIFDEKLSTCNWPAKESSCEVRNDKTTKTPAKTTPLSSLEKIRPTPVPSTKEETLPCNKHGFFRHPTNCSKFFRCVKSGPHFKSYVFSCPKKLVFDEITNSCNWPDKSAPCTTNFISFTKPPAHVIVSVHHFRDKTRSNRYPRSLTVRESAPSFPYLSSVFYATPRRTVTGSFVAKHGPGSNLTCEKEGVFKHPQYCHEFYVCSDFNNDKQSFTIFEFVCPNDMVYNEEVDDCAEPPPDSPCAHHEPKKCKHDGSEEDGSGETSKGSTESPDGSKKPGEDGSGPTTGSKTGSTTESTEPSKDGETDGSSTSTESNEDGSSDKGNATAPIKCKKSGFFRHPEDCNRFYRCVDYNNDSRNFVIYEFRCGDGLVFDEVNSVCNWPSSVPSCDSSAKETGEGTEEKEGTKKGTTTPGSVDKDGKTTDEGEASKSEGTVGISVTEDGAGSKSTPSSDDDDSSESSDKTKTSTTKSEGESTDSASTPDGGGESTDIASKPDGSTGSKTTLAPETGEGGTTSSSENIECTEAGFFRNPKNCSKFYRCVNDSDDGKSFRIFHFDCPSNLVFDEILDVCNWPDQAQPPCKTDNGTEKMGSKTTTESGDATNDGSTTKDGIDKDSVSTVGQGVTDSTTSRNTSDETGVESSTKDSEDSKDDCTKKPGDKGTSKEPPTDEESTPDSGDTDNDKPSEDGSTGPPSDNIECKKAGYFRNPSNCSKFYRCVGSGNSFRIYHFECPSNLVFDEALSVCNWPERARPPCKQTTGSSGDKNKLDSGVTTDATKTETKTTPVDNEKDGKPGTDGEKSISSTPSSKEVVTSSEKSAESSSTSKNEGETTSMSSSTSGDKEQMTTPKSKEKEDENAAGDGQGSKSSEKVECKKEGFYRNPKNCSKFYRCVDHGGNGTAFQVFHFDCPSNLVFDEVLSVCNWPDQAQPPCKQENRSKEEETKESTKVDTTTVPSDKETSGDGKTDGDGGNSDSTRETLTSTVSSKTTTDCPTDSKQTTQSSSTTGISKDGSETSESPEQITSASPDDGKSTSQGSEDEKSTSSKDTSSTEIKCKEEGFFRHPEDCSKFYRCVDYDGSKKSFTIFHFDCPENTAFDDILDVCVWPEQARPPCDGGKSNGSTTDKQDSSTESTIPNKITEDSTDNMETTKSDILPSTSQSSSTRSDGETTKSSIDTKDTTKEQTNADKSSTPSDGESSSSSSPIGDKSSTSQPPVDNKEQKDSSIECKKAGFYRHPKNCSKFYRCVDNSGSGKSFTIYHFECPNNTMFDDILDVCVWPEQVRPPCKMDSSEEGRVTTSSPKETDKGSEGSTSLPRETDEGSKENSSTTKDEDSKETTSDSVKETSPPPTQSVTSTDSSATSTTKDEDSKETTSDSVKETSPPPTQSVTPTDSSATSTTKKKKKPCPDDEDTEKPRTTTEPSNNKETTEGSGSGDCTKAGFFRNSEDCSKFYRCVDYGDGKTFKVYHFNCPENTVFDDVLDVCVWPGEEKPPCSNKTSTNDEDANIIPDGKERRRRQN